MSTSTNAYLFYGICWDEEDHWWPWHPEFGSLPEEQRADEEELDDDWLKRNLTSASELTIGEHCMQSCPMGFVAIRKTYEHAWRGYPNKLDLRSAVLHAREEEANWRTTLRGFCYAVGYDFEQLDRDGKVGWFLCSWWEE